jgi:Rod binding domain-containing protein
MDIPALQPRHLDPANLPLDRLAASTQIDQQAKVGEVSRAFEAVLLRQILQECQKPAFKSKLTGNTATDGIYQDMVVNQLAENISKSGAFGLAKHLTRELQRQTGAAGASGQHHVGIKAKSEIRGPKTEGNPKAEIRTPSHSALSGPFRTLALGFPSVLGYRASDFTSLHPLPHD